MNKKQLEQVVIFMDRYQYDLTSISGTKVNFIEYDNDGFFRHRYDIKEIINLIDTLN